MEQKERRRLGWMLEELMWQRRIKTSAELARRLREYNIEITGIHLSRIVRERPLRLSADLLEALTEVLDCSMDDLMPRTEEHASIAGKEPNKKKPAQPSVAPKESGPPKPTAASNTLPPSQPRLRAVSRDDDDEFGPELFSFPPPPDFNKRKP